MTISAFSDELAQVRTKKKEFLSQIERIVPWKEWLAMIQPCYYKGERGNKPYPLEIIFHVQRGSQISPKTTDLYSDASMLPRSTHAASHNNYTVKKYSTLFVKSQDFTSPILRRLSIFLPPFRRYVVRIHPPLTFSDYFAQLN